MRRVLFALLLAAVAVPFRAEPPQPEIQTLAAVADRGKVSVRFALDGMFQNGEIVEALQSGLPTTITYYVEIFRDRPNWFDKTVGRSRLEVVCTFNSVTREYLVNYRRDRRLVRSETFTDAASLQQRMTRIDEPGLFEIGSRKPYKLKVRVKADLMRGWLMYVIPWEVSTRWRETRVKTLQP